MDWVTLLNNVVAPILGALAGKYGFITQIVTGMGVARVMFKPIMTALQFYFGYLDTNPNDKVWLTNVMNSKWYPWIQFALDWVASIKLPPAQPSSTPTTTTTTTTPTTGS